MKKLHLSRNDRKIAGVCGGLGEMLDIDPNIVRIVFVVLTFVTGLIPLLLTYVAAWIILPEEEPVWVGDAHVEGDGTSDWSGERFGDPSPDHS